MLYCVWRLIKPSEKPTGHKNTKIEQSRIPMVSIKNFFKLIYEESHSEMEPLFPPRF